MCRGVIAKMPALWLIPLVLMQHCYLYKTVLPGQLQPENTRHCWMTLPTQGSCVQNIELYSVYQVFLQVHPHAPPIQTDRSNESCVAQHSLQQLKTNEICIPYFFCCCFWPFPEGFGLPFIPCTYFFFFFNNIIEWAAIDKSYCDVLGSPWCFNTPLSYTKNHLYINLRLFN